MSDKMQTSTMRPGAGQFTRALCRVPESEWPQGVAQMMTNAPLEVWRSRDYLVQVYRDNGYERLSVLRAVLDTTGRWADGIPWDDLQRLKAECGRGDRWAVEVYPASHKVVNVSNLRHLWLLPEPPPYGWHEER